MRFTLVLPTSLNKEEIEAAVLNEERTQSYLDGKTPKKVIVVPNKIVNIVMWQLFLRFSPVNSSEFYDWNEKNLYR